MAYTEKIKKNLLLLLTLCFTNYIALSEENLFAELDSANKTIFKINEVIISAKRFKQQKTDISFPVTSFSKEEVLFNNPQTTADLLNYTNKVFVQKSQQGGGSPMIRGFATNRLLYSVDGVRMNTAIFRSGNIQNVISLDPFAIENTEIIFGAAPVLYGSDGIGGVMSFQTLAPTYSTNDNLFVKGNSAIRFSSANQEKTGHFDINVGWDKWASVTSISYNDFGDLKMGTNGPDEYLRKKYVQRIDEKDVVITNTAPLIQNPSGYDQYNIMQKIGFKPNNNLEFIYGLHYSETSNYDRYDRLVREKKDNPSYGDWYYGPQKWLMNNLIINLNDITPALFDKAKIIIAQQQFEESRNDRSFNANVLHSRAEKINAYSVNADFAVEYATTSWLYYAMDNLYYGAEYIFNDVNSTGIDINIVDKTTTDAASRYPQADWQSIAAYIAGDKKVSEAIKVEAGIRYNRYMLDAKFDTTFYHFPFNEGYINNWAFTGNLGLIIKPSTNWIIQLNTSTAFRSPNVDDMGKVFDSHEGCVTVPNPDLQAEYAINYNIGITKLFGNIAKIKLNAYYTDLKDALVIRKFQLNGQDSIMYDGKLAQVEAVQNAANAYVYGIDADIHFNLFNAFYLSLYGNYQLGKEELDNGDTSPLRHAPPFFGKAILGYEKNKVKLNLYTCYAAEISNENMPEEEKGKTEIYAIDSNGKPYCPAWMTLNFKAEYKLNDTWAISAGLENILDARYRPYSSGIVSAGRNFVISFHNNF